MSDLSSFTQAIAEARDRNVAFNALCNLCDQVVGHKLFTVTIVDDDAEQVQRVYSNQPEAYPVSGTKPLHIDGWSRQVLVHHQTFVANDIEAIAKVFPDHELIASLGCGSVINVPIVVGTRVLGTLNILHEAGRYDAARVAASEDLKLPGAVCLLFDAAELRAEK